MRKKLTALMALGFTFAVAAVVFSAVPAAAAPPSPGACNMLNANAQGLAGMDGAAAQGRKNMLDLVLASEAVNPPPDCPPLP